MAMTMQRGIGLAAVIFGVLTIVSGFSVLLAGDRVADLAGNVVSGILWFNALSGFVYVAAGLCLMRNGPYAAHLANGLAVALVIASAALGWHIAQGGAFEPRTVMAMVFRTGFWLFIAVYVHRLRRMT